ncbi:MAG: 4Fe-4S binding protein [Oscillospiraceae bacterium]|nr:4Fe-4S binding protein [Oscillospiraceae bacterium]
MQTNRKIRRKAQVDRALCVACGCCTKVCPLQAVRVAWGLWAQVEESKCVGCGRCVKECPASVITLREVTA